MSRHDPFRPRDPAAQIIYDALLTAAKRKKTKFKLEPRYPHHRSDGMTHRRNAGTKLQEKQ